MKSLPKVPVVIGVGEVSNRSPELEEAREPLELAREAVRLAANDATDGGEVFSLVDELDVVNWISWLYGDPAAELAARLGMRPRRLEFSDWGGNQPLQLLDRAAARIAAGEAELIVVCGAEALASAERFGKAGKIPPWTPPPAGVRPIDPRSIVSESAWRHELRLPIHVYPLFENALRHELGVPFEENQRWSAAIWSDMSEVAAENPAAWNPRALSPEEIQTVTPENRLICHPYPKRMNAVLSVDQAAAVIVASEDTAKRLGVLSNRWIYPWGGAGASETQDVLARSGYARSPAMDAVLDDTLFVTGAGLADIDLFELYSCFPCVPKMAMRHLGLGSGTRVTVTGGLTFFGGAGNNYMLHAVAAMVRALRAEKGHVGLLYGQGGFVTKHHGLVLARTPRPGGYAVAGKAADRARQARVAAVPFPRVVDEPTGSGSIETYTVVYERNGEPKLGIVIGRLESGERFAANVFPGKTLDALATKDADPVGWNGQVAAGAQARNEFHLAQMH